MIVSTGFLLCPDGLQPLQLSPETLYRKLTLRVAGAVSPGEAGKAHAALEAGGSQGRRVIPFR